MHVPRVAGLHSKLWTRRFPSTQRLLRACHELLGPVFRRADGDTAMRAALRSQPLDRAALRGVMERYGAYASPEVRHSGLGPSRAAAQKTQTQTVVLTC